MAIPPSLIIANKINLTLNPIGMACASLVILSIIGLALVNRQLANRMTVRLISVIAITDLLAHIGEFYAASNMSLKLGTPLCTFVNGFRVFSRTFYCITNLAICFHLYRGLVLLKKSTWRSEVIIWAATVTTVAIFTLFYWGIGAFEGVKSRQRCTPGVDNPTLQVVFTIVQPTVNVITIMTCIFTTIVGHRYLNNWINTYAESRSYSGENQTKFKLDRKKMATRSFLYPLSTCITLPFEAIFLYLTASGAYALDMAIPMALGSCLSGVLTAIAFSIDPAAHKAFKSAYNQVRGRKVCPESITGNMSENTSILLIDQNIKK